MNNSNRPQDKWIALVLLVIFLSASTWCDYTEPTSHHKTVLYRSEYKQSPDTKIRTTANVKRSNDEYVMLMAKLIEHEAGGENFIGKMAVGNVLLNRSFGNKKLMKQEAFRKNAFTGFENRYPNIKPSKESIRAAQKVLSGTRVVSRGTRYFLNRRTATNKWIERNCKFEKKIGNHDFYSKGDK